MTCILILSMFFICFCLTSCICLSSPNYWLYIYILEPRAFMHILCGLIMFRICMYALVCIRHTYALKYKLCFYENFDFSWFHVFKEFHMSLIEYFHDWYVSHNTCSLTLLFTHDLFSWDYDMGFMDFECLVIMWFTCVSWKTILFYSLLEGFRTSLKVFPITSSYSSLW